MNEMQYFQAIFLVSKGKKFSFHCILDIILGNIMTFIFFKIFFSPLLNILDIQIFTDIFLLVRITEATF